MITDRTYRLHRAVSVCGLVALWLGAEPHLGFAQSGWSSPVNIDNSHERFSGHATMDFDSNGFVHAAWSDFNGGDVRVRYATNAGGSWVKQDVPLAGLGGGRNNCCLVITPDAMIHLFMQADGSSPIKTHAWEFTRPVAGGAWTGPQRISHDAGGNFDWAAVDDDGGILAVWVTITFGSGGGANYVRYKPLGGTWGPTTLVEQGWSEKWPGENHVTPSQDGRFFVSYRVDRPYYRIWDGGVLGPRVEIAPDGFAPRMDESPTGELVAVWHNDWRSWIKTSTDGGATWSAAADVSTSFSYLDRNAVVAFDGNGDLHVAWQKMFDGAGSDTYFRSRIAGVWEAEYNLTPWDLKNSYPSHGSLATRGGDLHMLLPADHSPDDFFDIVYMTKAGPSGPQPPVINALALSHDPLIADDTIEHTVTLEASDINGEADLQSMRFLVNYLGDHAGDYRGYVAWGQTPEAIHRYDSPADWFTSPVDSGSGYWGIHINGWGGRDYLTVREVHESTLSYRRTVSFTFTIKPQYAIDGPLSGNDIAAFADDVVSSSGWQNVNLDFDVLPSNGVPEIVTVSFGEGMLLPDNRTEYALTLEARDTTGADDIRIMRCLINELGEHAGEHRGYLAWGKTPEAIGEWGGVENWTIRPVNTGEGYWGIRMNGWGADDYLTIMSVAEQHAGDLRTAVFTCRVKPRWFDDGPLADNDIAAMAADAYVTMPWVNFDLDFAIYPLPLSIPDFDRDTDVDQTDLGRFQLCLTGDSAPQYDEACDLAKFDADNDVDQLDLDVFRGCLSGAEVAPDPTCAD